MTNHKSNIKVLIVGAGPAGLMMACQLSLFKIPFRIIDKKDAPVNYSGALIVQAKTLELFHQMGLAKKAVESGTKVNALSVFFNGKKTSRLEIKDIGKDLSQFSSMLMLEQSKTEQLLIQFLKGKGVSIEWKTELVDLTQASDKVYASLKLKDGSKNTINTSFLIAADGGQSTVRTLLGIPFHGKTHKEVLCIIECKSDIASADNEIYFSFSKDATTGFFPLPDGRWRIDAALKRVQNNDSKITFNRVKHSFDQETKVNANIHDHELFSVFHSHGKYAEKFQTERCFLIGDAAHLYTPVGAQGMNSGLQDAHNLAWKLAMVIQNRLKPTVLNSYEHERKPLAKKLTKKTSLFFNVVASDAWFYRTIRTNSMKHFLRLFLLFMKNKKFRNYVFKNISGTGISYKNNLLIGESGSGFALKSPEPGQRLPLFRFKMNGMTKDVREQIGSTAFHLLIFPKEKNTEKLLKATTSFSPVISVQQIPYSAETEQLYKKFGVQSGCWYLVRPDFHIACRSTDFEARSLKNFLHKIMLYNGDENK